MTTESNIRYEFGWGLRINAVLLVKETEKTYSILEQGPYASKHQRRRNKDKCKLYSSLEEIQAKKTRRLEDLVQSAVKRVERAKQELESWKRELCQS